MNSILKLAKYFEKFAQSVANDMAIRIMHSLIPASVNNPIDAETISSKLTAVHLINVAKRYVKRGCRLIINELSYAHNLGFHNQATKESEHNIIQIGKYAFSRPEEWDPDFGGPPWYNFADILEKLNTSISNFEKAKNDANYKKMSIESGLMSSYMNVLDGMSHNSGPFIHNMIINDAQAGTTYDGFLQKEEETLQLMDSKELSHVEDVLPFLRDYIVNNPEAYLYKELYSKLRREHRPNEERTQKEMSQIRQKKKALKLITQDMDKTIEKLQNYIKNPDLSSTTLTSLRDTLLFFSEDINLMAASSKMQNIIKKYKEAFIFAEPDEKELISLLVSFAISEAISITNEVKLNYNNIIYIVDKSKKTVNPAPEQKYQPDALWISKFDLCKGYWAKNLLLAAKEMRQAVMDAYS